MDGYDLIREVRRRGYHPDKLPAVAVSAFTRSEDQREAELAGFQAHIAKPVNLHELTSAIAELTGKAR